MLNRTLHIQTVIRVKEHSLCLYRSSPEIPQSENLHFDHIVVIVLCNEQAAVYVISVRNNARRIQFANSSALLPWLCHSGLGTHIFRIRNVPRM